MLRHLLKLIWKRKARNLMLSLEILLAFVLVFALAASAVRAWQLYHEPTGFAYRDVWSVAISAGDGRHVPNDAAVYDGLRRGLRELSEIEAVAFSTFAPYTLHTMHSQFTRPGSGIVVGTDMLMVSDEFFDVSGMTPAAGQWFGPADDGAAAMPAVINRHLAEQLFPGQAAVGMTFASHMPDGQHVSQLRVAAVVDSYRAKGELSEPGGMLLARNVADGRPGGGMQTILLRLKPGTPRAFEAALQRQLKLVRNDLSYTVAPLADLRAGMLKTMATPLAVMAVIGAFLLAMVAFGLFGVLWQNTTRRIPEIGLRRALGAPAGAIYRQIVAELLLLSSGAMLAGLALLVQLPLTGALGQYLGWSVFFCALGLSMALIYLLSLLCSLYPGWHASRLTPTAALRYE